MSECTNCCNRLQAGKADRPFVSKDYTLFCSVECFTAHVTGLALPDDFEAWAHARGIREVLQEERGGDLPVYSPLLHHSFRSGFESAVAETIALDWRMQLRYESHVIQLPELDKRYVPDFFLHAHGVWLEVKGEWRIGSQKKFDAALNIVGRDRLLLVPPSYRRWFASQSVGSLRRVM